MSKWIKQDFKVEMWGCDERTDNGYARTKMENTILGNATMKWGQGKENFLEE